MRSLRGFDLLGLVSVFEGAVGEMGVVGVKGMLAEDGTSLNDVDQRGICYTHLNRATMTGLRRTETRIRSYVKLSGQ